MKETKWVPTLNRCLSLIILNFISSQNFYQFDYTLFLLVWFFLVFSGFFAPIPIYLHLKSLSMFLFLFNDLWNAWILILKKEEEEKKWKTFFDATNWFNVKLLLIEDANRAMNVESAMKNTIRYLARKFFFFFFLSFRMLHAFIHIIHTHL